ncbi:hypothetical protein AgCh_014349 [Apium graveolens]
MALLTKFGRALRQEVNFGKSSLFSSTNTKADMKGDITDHMAIQEADPNSMYLGLPNEMVRNKNEILGFIKGRLPQRIQNWENKTLTHAGKVILLKTVAQALSSYAMLGNDFGFIWRSLMEATEFNGAVKNVGSGLSENETAHKLQQTISEDWVENVGWGFWRTLWNLEVTAKVKDFAWRFYSRVPSKYCAVGEQASSCGSWRKPQATCSSSVRL